MVTYLESKTTPHLGTKASKHFRGIYYVASIHNGIPCFQVLSPELEESGTRGSDEEKERFCYLLFVLFFPIGSSLIAFRSLLVQEIKLQETPKARG